MSIERTGRIIQWGDVQHSKPWTNHRNMTRVTFSLRNCSFVNKTIWFDGEWQETDLQKAAALLGLCRALKRAAEKLEVYL